MNRDPRIDAYIAARAEFARPILETIRERMHAASPDLVETIKWSSPHFTYKGKPLAGMAAFKAHAAFGFWARGARDPDASNEAMGDWGRIKSVADLPDAATVKAKVDENIARIASGVKTVRTKTPKPEIPMPHDFAAALAASPPAQATYDGFPPSCRREYLEWITEAKRPETRSRRIGEAVGWIAEGKRRNWKYETC